MRVDPTLVRSGQWWDHKVPPVIAAAVLTVLAAPVVSVGELMVDLALFLIATTGIAAFGHAVNDLADIGTDAIAGVPNQMAPLSTRSRSLVLAATVLAGLVPWIWLPYSPAVLALLGLELLLLVGYSVPPVRLKDRAAAGVLADALYAYVVPILLTVAVFIQVADVDRVSWLVVAPITVWMLLMGLRGILWHQIGDLAHDRRAGVHTLATQIGAVRGRRVLGLAVVVELAAAVTSLVMIGSMTGQWWLTPFALLYLIYRIFQMSVLWAEPAHPRTLMHPSGRIRFLGFVLMNEFVEKWLPIAALIALAVREPMMWAVVAIYLVLFDNAVREFLRRDLPAIPDALNRLAHEGKSRRNIRRVAEQRQTLTATGPAVLEPEVQERCRWVFVVCGPELHVDTLRTAVRHLRPLTSLEIWVVTDVSRNVHPIDVDGIDQIVDVATPGHLDDHQASIWLKTGVHRHVPPGEWCYLDSDIIAVRPGIEDVFAHRAGLVAFASDKTISVNQVDRFSPWAMTCECLGHGDQHSCSHLRDQLRDRFELEVPGDWVHWNGGVFLFGPDSSEFMDMWHERAVASFDWPEWRTRDQGALIATAWTLGQQDCERLPAEFNFIADLGNGDLCLDPERGWALHPAGPWHHARLMHLYTSRLEDPEWDLGRDVEAPVIRQTLVRTHRWRRNAASQATRNVYWAIRSRAELYLLRLRRIPQRLRPARLLASARRRAGVGGTE